MDILKVIHNVIETLYKNRDNEKYVHYKELIVKAIESVNKEYEKKLKENKDNKKKDKDRK